MNAQNNQWVAGGLGCYEKPQGAADRMFAALSALSSAIQEARKEGWEVVLDVQGEDVHITARKALMLTR